MQFDGDRLNIPLDLSYSEINEIKDFISQRLDYIEEIGFEEGKVGLPVTSSLFAFLVSLKKTKPSLKIDMFNSNSFVIDRFGTVNWICHG